ncbi:hypothetical protein SKAU_G00198690 [Synaphobranchus kaupii]|uniref:Uncharacterized protein n=1 Tax=Synaphobranchus kaupii TaxID=118154 RepID=A0A9Q1FF20_SYNKA|nr:hypothetical protein SKAU_G00198690 [Synaphobranchus kaupii]
MFVASPEKAVPGLENILSQNLRRSNVESRGPCVPSDCGHVVCAGCGSAPAIPASQPYDPSAPFPPSPSDSPFPQFSAASHSLMDGSKCQA